MTFPFNPNPNTILALTPGSLFLPHPTPLHHNAAWSLYTEPKPPLQNLNPKPPPGRPPHPPEYQVQRSDVSYPTRRVQKGSKGGFDGRVSRDVFVLHHLLLAALFLVGSLARYGEVESLILMLMNDLLRFRLRFRPGTSNGDRDEKQRLKRSLRSDFSPPSGRIGIDRGGCGRSGRIWGWVLGGNFSRLLGSRDYRFGKLRWEWGLRGIRIGTFKIHGLFPKTSR